MTDALAYLACGAPLEIDLEFEARAEIILPTSVMIDTQPIGSAIDILVDIFVGQVESLVAQEWPDIKALQRLAGQIKAVLRGDAETGELGIADGETGKKCP